MEKPRGGGKSAGILLLLGVAIVATLGTQFAVFSRVSALQDAEHASAARGSDDDASPALAAAEEAMLEALPEALQEVATEILTNRAFGPGQPSPPAPSAASSSGPPQPPRKRATLPPMYGASGAVVGLERCAAFRESTSLFRRSAVAGIFNSGTNFFTNLFRRNCVMPRECPKIGQGKMMEMMKRGECLGYPFQTPWGKHNPLSWRDSGHVVDSLAHFNRSEILPVVMVKDPLTWARSMCRNAYAARFKKDPKCCPSPLDMLTARDHPSLTNGNSTVTVPFRLDRPERYESLLNLWSTWYGAYWDSDMPRLMVRYEDLLFEPQQTLERVCDCVGGRLKTGADFDPIAEPAKKGKSHGNGVSRAAALQRYASEATRYALLDARDLAYFQTAADPRLVAAFHYFASDERRAAAAPDADQRRAESNCGVAAAAPGRAKTARAKRR